MFKSIKIKNLRAITELEINNLGQVNLLVGQNNCGKTTILEALFFLTGATNPRLPLTANSLRGFPFLGGELWSTFFHNRKMVTSIEIYGVTRDSLEEHHLVISPRHEGRQETKSISSNFVSLEAERTESGTPFVPTGLELKYVKSKDPAKEVLTRVFEKGKDILFEGVPEVPLLRGYYMNPSTLLSDVKDRFGEAQRKKRLPQLIAFLKEIDPNISDLRLNEIGLLEADIGLSGLIPVNLMGGGIGKFLSVALGMLVYQDGIVLIDEVDNGLYYSAQQKLWEAILNWAHELNVQVFATTHSWECIRAFNACAESTLFGSEAKLYRIERKDEEFRAVEYAKDILAESLDSNWEIR